VENIVQSISGTRDNRTVNSKSNSLCTHNNIIDEVGLSLKACCFSDLISQEVGSSVSASRIHFYPIQNCPVSEKFHSYHCVHLGLRIRIYGDLPPLPHASLCHAQRHFNFPYNIIVACVA
jgi:hypothetical protein